MFGSFFNAALANQFYGVAEDFDNIDVLANPPYAISLQDAVQAKLASIDTSHSLELKQFVLLKQHEWDADIAWFTPQDFEPRPKIYDAYGQLYQSVDLQTILTPEQVEFLNSPEGYRLRRWLLLNLIFDLIDRVVDYWGVIESARRRWKSVSTAFRRCLETALKFKPFHTPLRLFPNSIRPIDSVA